MLKTFSSNREEQVLLGTLLGDGSLRISARFVNPRVSFRHSEKQKEYFDWKVRELKSFSSAKDVWFQSADLEDKGGAKWRYQSAATPDLMKIYKLITKRGRKTVTRRWLNKLTPLSLALWWMDDGSIVGNGRKGILCTDSFSEEEIKIIVRYFRIVWDINVRYFPVHKSRPGQFRLSFATEELKKLFRIFLADAPKIEGMAYKFLLLYKDLELQQRWISEVSELTGFDEAILHSIVEQRKASLKYFRE